MSRLLVAALLWSSLLAVGASVRADEIEEFDVETSSPVNNNRQDRPAAHDDSWYYQPSTEPTTYKPNPRQIHQQKAIAHGQQRADRLAALAWYGMSNSRPTAAPTPFTSMYSPSWQTPGGRPFAWYPGRPVYIFR